MDRAAQLRSRIRFLLVAFMIATALSGITAFPLRWEVNHLARLLDAFGIGKAGALAPLVDWVTRVQAGLSDAYGKYPFIAYGTDWLAFGHLVIALAFIGPLRDPVRNVWVVEWAMVACVGVIPLAFIGGQVRDIPVFHRLVDCAFGVFGIVPLWLCRRDILALAAVERDAVIL